MTTFPVAVSNKGSDPQTSFWESHAQTPELCGWGIKENCLPGRKPGTSTNVTSGILKASQNLTNLAPFTDALMSRQPEIIAFF